MKAETLKHLGEIELCLTNFPHDWRGRALKAVAACRAAISQSIMSSAASEQSPGGPVNNLLSLLDDHMLRLEEDQREIILQAAHILDMTMNRKPLTEKRIYLMAGENTWHRARDTFLAYRDGIRDAETAHGILPQSPSHD